MNSTNGVHPTNNTPGGFGIPTRMIVLGYYDGPTYGVFQFGEGGPVYRFEMPDEDTQLSRQSFPRDYALQALPVDALDRLEAALAAHLIPTRPAWYVNWQFPNEDAECETASKVDAILAEAGPPEFLVTAPSWSFIDFRPTRIVACQPI